MDHRYEFLSDWQEQVFSQYRWILLLKNNQLGVRARVFLKLGDALINFGSWLKRAAHSPIEGKPISLFTQNT